MGGGSGEAAGAAPAVAATAAAAAEEVDLLGDLLALDDGTATAAAIAAPPPGEGGGDPFAALASPAAALAASVAVAAPGAPPPLPADLFAAEPVVVAAPAPVVAQSPAPEPAPAPVPVPEPALTAAPAVATAPVAHTAMPALSLGAPLTVSLAFSKPGGPASPDTAVAATLSLAGGGAASTPLTGVSLQAAVPKYARLTLSPASGGALAPGGPPITQSLTVTNTAHGAKPLALRLRVAWRVGGGGEEVVEMVQVDGLPEGL